MPKSLLEQLPEIVAQGRKVAEKILENMESRHRVTLHTREVVLPAKDSAASDWITSQRRNELREVFAPGWSASSSTGHRPTRRRRRFAGSASTATLSRDCAMCAKTAWQRRTRLTFRCAAQAWCERINALTASEHGGPLWHYALLGEADVDEWHAKNERLAALLEFAHLRPPPVPTALLQQRLF